MVKRIFVFVFAAFIMTLGACGLKETPKQSAQSPAAVQTVKLYTCPMHQEFISTNPNDKCPRCGMNLVEKR